MTSLNRVCKWRSRLTVKETSIASCEALDEKYCIFAVQGIFVGIIIKASAASLKVARYSFSRSIPPKFERKLRRHKQGFGKIDTTVVLDKEENWL